MMMMMMMIAFIFNGPTV